MKERRIHMPRLMFSAEAFDVPLKDLRDARPPSCTGSPDSRYRAMRRSIEVYGQVTPLVIFPPAGDDPRATVLDGSNRLGCLQEASALTAQCVAPVKERALDRNERLYDLSVVQEHQIITRALHAGMSAPEISAVLGVPVANIAFRLDSLIGVCDEAIELLSATPAAEGTFVALRRMHACRQLECVRTMVCLNDYSRRLTDALLRASRPDQLKNHPRRHPWSALSTEPARAMQQDLAQFDSEATRLEATHAATMLELTVVQGHIRRLLCSGKLVGWLARNHPERLQQLQQIAELESVDPLPLPPEVNPQADVIL